MTRFDYLEPRTGKKSGRKRDKKAKKAERKAAKTRAAEVGPVTIRVDPTAPPSSEQVSRVYVRQETVRAVWREVKRDGGESVSELVEDLLLAWLRARTR
ncbi:hypothetical protein E7T09_03870 [Deinococcus sp. KSM4-11]|uniref:hypothetical protein n=1 Tax=Deinococcus sp. KSM4-11 TaxID=2568654 RepID=UPI0010A44390|nr:hypothetical protein [Deinococcus sp. KSM4-11]THF88352.1 hypothetical protein E7T09_03870 [Deinococcus sp. KSM4-11]